MKRANSTLFATYILIVVAAILTAPAMAGGKQKGAFDCPDGEAVIGFDEGGTPNCSEIFPPAGCPCWTMQALVDAWDAYIGAARHHSKTCSTIPVPIPESVDVRVYLDDPVGVDPRALAAGTVNAEIFGNHIPVNGNICHITILGGTHNETEAPIQCLGNESADVLDCQYNLSDEEFDSCNGILRDFALNTQSIPACDPVIP